MTLQTILNIRKNSVSIKLSFQMGLIHLCAVFDSSGSISQSTRSLELVSPEPGCGSVAGDHERRAGKRATRRQGQLCGSSCAKCPPPPARPETGCTQRRGPAATGKEGAWSTARPCPPRWLTAPPLHGVCAACFPRAPEGAKGNFQKLKFSRKEQIRA